MTHSISLVVTALLAFSLSSYADDRLVFDSEDGPGKGKHVVIVTGDEEYRSEETGPMLGKILSQHHGFKVTVLFAIDPETGFINPQNQKNIPGLESLETADLMILDTRFRNLPDEQLQPIADYVLAGKPIIGLRTSTHAFKSKSKVGDINWNTFGLDFLGERWVSHHGKHKTQGALGIPVEENKDHPVMRTVGKVFAPSDVYTVKNLDESKATVLMRAAVTETIAPDSKPIEGAKNDPLQAAVWIHEYTAPNGTTGTSLTTTMGSSVDFKVVGLRQLVVNGAYFLTGLEVPENVKVKFVDPFQPTFFGVNPADYYNKVLKLKPSAFGLGKKAVTGLASTMKEMNVGISYKQVGNRPQYEQPTPAPKAPPAVMLPLKPEKGERIVFIGNSLGERMLWHGHFEAELFSRFPDHEIYFRNMCHPADTPGFRAHPARVTQWAFPGAEKFHPDKKTHFGKGHYPYPDEWLTDLKADTVVAFFGFNESFDGLEGLENFKAELSAFVDHTLSLSYNGGKSAPNLVLVTPIAFEDRTDAYDLPTGEAENGLLKAYSEAVLDVAAAKKVGSIDLFSVTSDWFAEEGSQLTMNGCHLNEDGYKKLAPVLADQLIGGEANAAASNQVLLSAIRDRNWIWHNDYRMLNGVHVWGQRWEPYGNFNYPEEITKIREMGNLRDEKIWAAADGKSIEVNDGKTKKLSKVETNYGRPIKYLETPQAKALFQMPEDFEISLFASEESFPNLQNPCQMSFDNQGRLWVSTVPSYPHYKPGGELPNDKILVYEDTDGDGKADKETVFAENLHIPIGFELAPEGVYLSEEPYLLLIQDTDGDGKADKKIRLLDGFDSHDTHHAISAYSADASGALYLCEGRFLHSQVETPYGPQRMTDGGLWRFDPYSWKLTRHSQSDYSNPWAVAFDDYGQDFMGDASGGANWWLLPLSAKIPHGKEIAKTAQFTTHKVRPTSGSEFISSRHFPEQYQGHYLLNNTIGFLGTKHHSIVEDSAGFTGQHVQDLVRSDDGNYRPSDLEFGPDGALYIVDWHNALIGHMQHSARDPNRNSQYGRIYRVTHKGSDLVDPPMVEGASIATLLENFKLHEYRARYRSRRELREHPADEVIPAVKKWVAGLDEQDPTYGRSLLEGLWATWAQGAVDADLLDLALAQADHRVRSSGVDVLRFNHDKIEGSTDRFLKAAADSHPRVRLEALVAASWLDNETGAQILFEALKQPLDKWMGPSVEAAWWTLEEHAAGLTTTENPTAAALVAGTLDLKVKQEERPKMPAMLSDADKQLWLIGEEVFHRDAYCGTCHGANGKGAIPNVYPPLVKSKWVTGSEERLIKLTLHGLWGDIEVLGKKYSPANGVPPMTAFGPMLNDKEIAGVLTYVRNAWGNEAPAVKPETVKAVRKATADHPAGVFYKPEELLKAHPMEK